MTSRSLLSCACTLQNKFAPYCQGAGPKVSRPHLPTAQKVHLAHLVLTNGCGVVCQSPALDSDLDASLNCGESESINAYLRFFGREQVASQDYPAAWYPSQNLSFVNSQGVDAVLGSARRKELELQHAHQEITRILQTGQVVEAEKNPISGYGHKSYIVVLRDPRSTRKIRALFKPVEEGNGQGWHRVPIEWVAYKLNLMLGLDLVPPAVHRHDLDVDFERFNEGVFMYFANKASMLKETPCKCWGVDREVLMSDTRILDVLLQNSDRHHGNFLFGEHWAKGHWQGGKWRGNMTPILIDHAAGFRAEADVRMTHENAFQTGRVKRMSARTYMRLRFLDLLLIENLFSEILTKKEIAGLFQHRISILKYFEDLVEEQGFEQIIVDSCS